MTTLGMITYIEEEGSFDPGLIQERLNREALCCTSATARDIFLDLIKEMDKPEGTGIVRSSGWKLQPYYLSGFMTVSVELQYRVLYTAPDDSANAMTQITSIKIERDGI